MGFGFKRKALEEKRIEAQQRLDARLAEAAEDGNLSKMSSFIGQGANPNAGLYPAARYGREWPALRGGYAYDSINPMALLLGEGADVNAPLLIHKGAGYTPLSASLDNGHMRLAGFIMSRGGRIADSGENALSSSTGWNTFLKIGNFTQYSEQQVRQFIRHKERSEAAAKGKTPLATTDNIVVKSGKRADIGALELLIDKCCSYQKPILIDCIGGVSFAIKTGVPGSFFAGREDAFLISIGNVHIYANDTNIVNLGRDIAKGLAVLQKEEMSISIGLSLRPERITFETLLYDGLITRSEYDKLIKKRKEREEEAKRYRSTAEAERASQSSGTRQGRLFNPYGTGEEAKTFRERTGIP